MGKAAMIGLAMAGMLISILPASAQSTTCLRLVNELAALESGGGFRGGGARHRQYEDAIREQRAQINKTERAAQANGCGRQGGFFLPNRDLCRRIADSLGQMYRNLEDLQANLARQSRGSGGSEQQRRAILRAMASNGCEGRGVRQQVAARAEPRRRSLLEQIFGVRTYREDGSRAGTELTPDGSLGNRYGTFRTLCVRTCDGYYFPISFSTVSDRFGDDEMTCQAMCPGQDVRLYFHAMPAQDSEDMISYRTEEPYTQLSTAFSYRKAVNPDCTCRFAAGSGLSEVAGSGGISEVRPGEAEAPRLAIPTPRFDPGLDPETTANAGGRFTLKDVDRLARRGDPQIAVPAEGNGRRVRVVGPSFFPVQ